jgi:penicillin-insensitive murein DD-endopeptidase
MWPILVASIVAGVPANAFAQHRTPVLARVVRAPARLAEAARSASTGEPNRGALRGGVRLAPSPHLFVRTSRRSATWGTAELVGLIERASAAVGSQHPGSRLVVGDLSRRNGGRVHPHRSHRSGRDADIGFYLVDDAGRPSEPPHFVHVGRDGCGELRGVRYCFDAARNYALMARMLADPVARVQYVFVAPDIRRRLVEEGERRRAPPEELERVRIATEPHSGSHSHRSHFHVRIYCPSDDRPSCIDEPPYHAWYDGTPAPRVRHASRPARVRRAIARRRASIRAAARRRERDRRRA